MARDEAESTKKRRSRKRRALSIGRVLSLLAFLPVASRAPAYAQLIMALLVDGRMPASRKAMLAGGRVRSPFCETGGSGVPAEDPGGC